MTANPPTRLPLDEFNEVAAILTEYAGVNIDPQSYGEVPVMEAIADNGICIFNLRWPRGLVQNFALDLAIKIAKDRRLVDGAEDDFKKTTGREPLKDREAFRLFLESRRVEAGFRPDDCHGRFLVELKAMVAAFRAKGTWPEPTVFGPGRTVGYPDLVGWIQAVPPDSWGYVHWAIGEELRPQIELIMNNMKVPVYVAGEGHGVMLGFPVRWIEGNTLALKMPDDLARPLGAARPPKLGRPAGISEADKEALRTVFSIDPRDLAADYRAQREAMRKHAAPKPIVAPVAADAAAQQAHSKAVFDQVLGLGPRPTNPESEPREIRLGLTGPLTSKVMEEAGRLVRRAIAWRMAWNYLIASGLRPPLSDAELDRVTADILEGRLVIPQGPTDAKDATDIYRKVLDNSPGWSVARSPEPEPEPKKINFREFL